MHIHMNDDNSSYRYKVHRNNRITSRFLLFVFFIFQNAATFYVKFPYFTAKLAHNAYALSERGARILCLVKARRNYLYILKGSPCFVLFYNI